MKTFHINEARDYIMELLEQEDDLYLTSDLDFPSQDILLCGNICLRINYIRHQYNKYKKENPNKTIDNDDVLYTLYRRMYMITPPFIIYRSEKLGDE